MSDYNTSISNGNSGRRYTAKWCASYGQRVSDRRYTCKITFIYFLNAESILEKIPSPYHASHVVKMSGTHLFSESNEH